MGKKLKTGKARKDKFYQLAKETGYRARSAFKLLQLNRKYEFLQGSRVCIDLCAAPGSWLQVAAQQMPVSSLIIGVDFVSIKPIHSVMTFQEDITTAKCRQTISRELKTWKADVVLHDGAPNVGKNWLHDAFQQAQLTLQALKLASEFLRKGGWFITKVFRSRDYHALLWVFKQLFKKVHATKPKASRNESAEIFVVCQGYVAPDVLDAKFTDPKFVFKDVASQAKTGLNLIHPEKVKKKALGYADDDYTLHHKLTVTQFMTAENHLELLANCNELVFDDDTISSHKLTTNEIKECCKDIKVLGKKELRSLMNWRKKMVAALKPKEVDESQTEAEEAMEEGEEEGEEEEETKIEEKLAELQETERKDVKRKRKKVMKEKRKLRDKMSLNMIIPGDQIEQTTDSAMFDLEKIKHKHLLDGVQVEEMDAGSEVDSEDDDDDLEMSTKSTKKTLSYERFDKDDPLLAESGDEEEEEDYMQESDEDLEMESDDDDVDGEGAGSDEGEGGKDTNPLLVDMVGKEKRDSQKTDMWFSKDVFAGLEEENDEDIEIEKAMEMYRKKGGVIIEKAEKHQKTKEKKRKKQTSEPTAFDSDNDDDGSVSNDDVNDDADGDDGEASENSDYDDTDMHDHLTQEQKTVLNRATKKCGGFEIVPANAPMKKIIKLNHIELAIGEEIIKSSKRKREIVEMSHNRYMFDDDHLPEWFTTDESRHCKRQLPVTKEQIALYKEQLKLINARPIKKVAEARARKKQKSMKKLEKVRNKAQSIHDAADVTEGEKWKQVKDMYRKAGLLSKKKEKKTYIVAKKGAGKKVHRPAGVKGQFKVVDPRMKKDKINTKDGKKGKKGKQRGRKR